MDYISQFITDIRYFKGQVNTPADALSRNVSAVDSSFIDYAAIAADQANDVELQFDHVHVDLVCPLLYSNEYRYILIYVNRFTRWPEAIPLADIHADTVARAFITGWTSGAHSDQTLAPLMLSLYMEHLSGYLVNFSAVPLAYAAKLRDVMSKLRPVRSWQLSSSKSFVSQDLHECTHVFVRVDSIRRPLQPPYEGPYEVLRRTRKNVTINRNGTSGAIAIDRAKPAYLLDVPNSLANPVQPLYVQPKKSVSFLLTRH
ncbi:uncharacterized protein LOC125043632 [Penaeus chinensis]|uniref:uncharacterized protein LOC125043632 n=1 Tax=Penaeus chinensis TaxID=139456 RepID=UPI001FB77155|nr:uncharacterized protein LOC125043632 [Penaeus chinensis]